MSNKILSGEVVSSHEGTISVEIERLVRHKIYQKTLKVHKKILADDKNMTAKVGDVVEIIETKPISKRKSWMLKQIIK